MRVVAVLFSILVLGLLIPGCRKPPEKPEVREPIFPSPPVEDLEGLYAYATGTNGYAVVDLYAGDVIHQSKTTSSVASACLSSDGSHLYLAAESGVSVVDLVRLRIKEKIGLNTCPTLLLPNPRGDEIFILDSLRTLTVVNPSGKMSSMEIAGIPQAGLVTPDGASVVIAVSSPPRSFVEVVDWLIKNVVKTVDIPAVNEIAVTPYGVRMYLLSGHSCHVYDGRSFQRIAKIDFPSPPTRIRMTPSGSKIYLLASSKVYVVSRTKNALVSEIGIPGEVVDLVFTHDGGWGYAATVNPSRFFMLDAGIDSILLAEDLSVAPLMLAASPGDSRIYVLTESDSLMTFDVSKREFVSTVSLDIGAFDLVVNQNRMSIEVEKEEPVDVEVPAPEVPVIEGFRDGFTIQISSSRDLSSAEALASRLRSSGYPAYVSSSDTPDGLTWYRVRAGLFDSRQDADVVARDISGTQNIKSWVTSASINVAVLPELPAVGRDMNSDGKPEASYRLDARHVVVYTIDRGIYARVYQTSNEQDVYLGSPRMTDVDGDGDQEAVTELLEEGKVSVINFAGGAYAETITTR
jgi:hypothetical protein